MKHVLSHHLVISLSLVLLAACGFEPMAGSSTRAYNQQSLPAAVANVDIVATSPGHQRILAEQFRTSLEDLINPGMQRNNTHDYRLQVALSPVVTPGLIAPDGKAQRYLVNMTSNYQLFRNSDGKMIDQGVLNRNSSYSNLPNTYYSTYIAEQDTLKRLNQELAEQYRMKLAAILSAPPPAPSEMPAEPVAIPTYDPTRMFQPENGVAVPFGQ